MIATGSHINLDENTGLFLIPGFPIQPTAEAVVTRWKLP